MRLTRLVLQKYGNFADLDLSLAGRPGCIDVVVAPNGAGKSVLRQAICELLFGVHPMTKMAFRYGYPGLRIKAEALGHDGASLAFVRRKGDGNTVMDWQGAPAGRELLARLPATRDQERLMRLFALDSDQLVAGGKQLLQTGGDLADALLSGAGELQSARALAAGFRSQWDAAAPLRSKKSPFYDAAAALKAARAQLAEALIRPRDWRAHEERRDAAAVRRTQANSRFAAQAVTVRRLERIRRTRLHLATLNEAEAWLAAHADAPRLAADIGPRLAASKQALAASSTALEDRQTQLDALIEQRASIAPDERVLMNAEAIAELTGERGKASQSETDLPKREAERKAARETVAAILRQLGSARPVEAARTELRSAADIAAARELVVRHGALGAAVAEGPASLTRARLGIAEAKRQLAELPPVATTERLEALIAEITAEGQPASLAEEARRAEAGALASLQSALARVPGFTGEASALFALAVPSDAEFTRLDQAFQAATVRLAAADKEQERDAKHLAQLHRSRSEQDAGGPLADQPAVESARLHRDHGWQLIRRHLLGQSPDLEAEAAFMAGRDLFAAYERSVVGADNLADRRLDEAARVQQAASLARDVLEADAALAVSRATRAAALGVQEAARGAWSAACTAVNLAAETDLAAARAFAASRLLAIDAAARHQVAGAEAAALGRRHAEWARRLAAALMEPPQDALPPLLSMARLSVSRAHGTQMQRASLLGKIQAAQADLDTNAAAFAEAEQRLQAWSIEWQDSLAALGRPAGETPAALNAVLDLLVRLEAAVAEMASSDLRMAEMHAQLAAFHAQAKALASRLDMVGDDPSSCVLALSRRLDAARAQAGAARSLDEQIAAATTERQRARQRKDADAQSVAAVLREVGAVDAGSAATLVQLSADRGAHEQARQLALQRLAEDGDGLSPDELRLQATAATAEWLAGEIEAAAADSQAAHAEAQEAAQEEEREQQTLDRLAASEAAPLASSNVEAATATLSRVLEDALVHHTAAAMLEDALQSVEASGDDPRLARISVAFAALTRGACNRVSSGEGGKSHRILLAHEAGEAEGKQVEHLSEGTRDQLYLALRLVAIEDHVAASPPLPFIADDILQTFDDGRALAAFEALIRLSSHTQVIVLTHHEHLAALARTLPEAARHIQHLP